MFEFTTSDDLHRGESLANRKHCRRSDDLFEQYDTDYFYRNPECACYVYVHPKSGRVSSDLKLHYSGFRQYRKQSDYNICIEYYNDL